jgi:3-dehydroquinate synthase
MQVLQEPELPVRLERLLQRLGLPVRLPQGATAASLHELMMRDKKVEGGRIRWVLPVRAGEVTLTPDVTPAAVQRAIDSIRG